MPAKEITSQNLQRRTEIRCAISCELNPCEKCHAETQCRLGLALLQRNQKNAQINFPKVISSFALQLFGCLLSIFTYHWTIRFIQLSFMVSHQHIFYIKHIFCIKQQKISQPQPLETSWSQSNPGCSKHPCLTCSAVQLRKPHYPPRLLGGGGLIAAYQNLLLGSKRSTVPKQISNGAFG